MSIYRKALITCAVILSSVVLVFASSSLKTENKFTEKLNNGKSLTDNIKVKLSIKDDVEKIVEEANNSPTEEQKPPTKIEQNKDKKSPNTPPKIVQPVVKPPTTRTIADRGNFQRVIDNVSSGQILGIDISHHQSDRGDIDWKKVAESKVKFAFIKVSEGNTYKDPYAKRHFEGARSQSIAAGGYHYARPKQPIENDAKAEVAHFISRLKVTSNDYGDLPAVLDLEDPLYPGTNGLSTDDLLKWAKIFCEEFEKYTGHKIIIYTGNWFVNTWNNFNGDQNPLLNYPVWIADYYSNKTPNGGWKSWFVWQFSDKGKIDGITGDVDLNISSSKLLTYCK